MIVRDSLRTNILSLGSIQIVGYILPLITLPYVVRVMGVEAWGTVVLVQIIIGYINLIPSWGFKYTGTAKIAVIRDDVSALSTVFMSIWVAQWILFIVSVFLILTLTKVSEFFGVLQLHLFYGVIGLAANVLFPVWLFSGLECLKKMAMIQIIVRTATLPAIFLLVDTPEDGPVLIAITESATLLAGLISILSVRKSLNITLRTVDLALAMKELRAGAGIFFSTICIGVYTSLVPVILGAVLGNMAVGQYVLADRPRQLAQATLGPISQALYPRLSSLYSCDYAEAIKLLLKSSQILIIASLLISAFLWLGADLVIAFFAGVDNEVSVSILRWLSPLPLIITMSNILGVQIMLPLGRKSAFNKILLLASILSIALIYPLILALGSLGAAICTLLVECFVTSAMAIHLFKSWPIKPYDCDLKDKPKPRMI